MKLGRTSMWLLAGVSVLLAGISLSLAWITWRLGGYDPIERCLDKGGSWHYDRGVCDFEVNYEGPRP